VLGLRLLARMCRMSGSERSLLTPRLRLVPIGSGNAGDLWLVHNDDAVVPWYDGWRPSRHEADDYARRIAESWRLHGVHKWMASDRETGEVVGRGGLSRTPIDDDWGQLYAFLPDEPWVREAHESERPFRAHAHWLEIGWALRRDTGTVDVILESAGRSVLRGDTARCLGLADVRTSSAGRREAAMMGRAGRAGARRRSSTPGHAATDSTPNSSTSRAKRGGRRATIPTDESQAPGTSESVTSRSSDGGPS
jgi:RimJ/RimL family protein N-acetyltransferase